MTDLQGSPRCAATGSRSNRQLLSRVPKSDATNTLSFVDDAGKPLPLIPLHLRTEALRDDDPNPGRAWRTNAAWWIALVMSAALLVYLGPALLVRFGQNVVLVSATTSVAFMILLRTVIPLMVRRRQRGGMRPLLPASATWLAAHGRCGACGYRLPDMAPDAAGLRICPECGAAWHHHRCTLMNDSTPMRPESDSGAPAATDDRGVWLQSKPVFPPIWIYLPTTPQSVVSRVLSRGRVVAAAQRTRRLWLGVPIVFVFWIAGTAALLAILRAFGENWRSVALPWSAITGIISLLLVYLLCQPHIGPRELRRLVLAEHVCLGCGSELPVDDASARQFDGCLACTSCGRAWKPETDV